MPFCEMWSICYSAETKWKPEERFVSTTTTGKQGEEHEQHTFLIFREEDREEIKMTLNKCSCPANLLF